MCRSEVKLNSIKKRVMSRGRGNVVCVCLILFLGISIASANAKSHEKKWGHISRKNLMMKVYTPDSSATAVMLFDVGKITHDQKLDFYLERHVRIKILTDQGYDWATVKIPILRDAGQRVTRIAGETYYLDVNGKMHKVKLGHKDIYKEKVDKKVEVVKFTLPKVRPGAIIEYRYKKEIGDPQNIHDWTFQHDIPAEWSELNFRVPSWYKFKFMMRGTQPLSDRDTKQYSQIIDLNALDGFDAAARTEAYSLKGIEYHWALKDIPALKKESHIFDRDFYRSRMLIQFSSITITDSQNDVLFQRNLLGTWPKVRDQLLKAPEFGGRLKDRAIFKKQLTGVVNDQMSQMDKLKAIYHFVKKTIEWNKEDAIFCDARLKDVFKRKTGTSAEINMLLVQMLRESGILAYPVLASTRKHGPIIPSIPIASQFNTVVCMAEINNKKYFLDATDPYRPYIQIPERLANCKGLVIKKEPEQLENKLIWVTLKEKPWNERNVSITGVLNTNGQFDGMIGIRFNGYFGTEYRKDLAGAKSVNKYVRKHFLGHFDDVKIDTVVVRFQKKEELPLMLNIRLTGKIKALKNGDLYYMNPKLLFRREKNPFTAKTRTLPVDFSYPRAVRYMLRIKLDRNLSVVSKPKSVLRKMQNNSVVSQYAMQMHHDTLMVFSGMNLMKYEFLPQKYKALRSFFGHVVEDQNSKIVLKDKQ